MILFTDTFNKRSVDCSFSLLQYHTSYPILNTERRYKCRKINRFTVYVYKLLSMYKSQIKLIKTPMKRIHLYITSFLFIFFSCQDDVSILSEDKVQPNQKASFERLLFSSSDDLHSAIEKGEGLAITRNNFISMLSNCSTTRDANGEELTYYEALGYDSLIPNRNFAQLLNPIGELEVGNDVIRITPNGTYRYSIENEEMFNNFIKENPDYMGEQIDEDTYKINEYITLYRTFNKNVDNYAVISEGEFEELPDDFFGDDEIDSENIQTRAIPEPNFASFPTYSADRKTWAGKIIQNLIGSSKDFAIKFNSKRRVKGSFYFYNYGVYSEIGVQGWTDKKNWIGWSKTQSDELRVGWNNIILKSTIPDYYKQSLANLKSMAYCPPQYVDVNGRKVNVATLAMPEFEPTFKDRVLSQGTKAVIDLLKNKLKRPASEWQKAEAFIVATRTELYYVSGKEDVVKYNTKSYTHVFAKHFMSFEIGYNSQSGFFVNGVNQNNYKDIAPWFKTISKAFSEKKSTLISGEVYSCARFGNEWRGMKIVKK